jgi:cell fate regulator YaaT (PSP1 superfamily)
MADQAAQKTRGPEMLKKARELVKYYNINIKFIEADAILGGEVLTFYYMSEDRVDFRELVRDLAAEFRSRIEMRQVGARDEARLVADYERCGQHCCCKTFLKVLRPVSMRSAKMQKATLDPLKISGRCGRLMCCLRYEDQTYKDLKANLPHRKTRVGTEYGVGIVIDSKILTQLVLVKLEHNNEQVAIPLEELIDPETCPTPADLEAQALAAEREAMRVLEKSRSRTDRQGTGDNASEGDDKKKRRRRRRGKKQAGTDAPREADGKAPQPKVTSESSSGSDRKKKRRRRRRRGKGGAGGGGEASS